MRQSLKYEFKQNWKDFLVSYIIMFVAFIILALFLFLIRAVSDVSTFLFIIYTNIILLVVLAMAGSSIVFAINVIRGCYVKMFGDEGYLTLSLPISTHTLILSKIIANIIWAVLYLLVFIFGICFVTVSLGETTNELFEIFENFIYFFKETYFLMPFFIFNFIISLVLSLIILLLSFCLINLTTIKKGKIILGILIYSGFQTAINIINALFSFISFGLTFDNGKLGFDFGIRYNYNSFLSPIVGMTGDYVLNITQTLVYIGLIIGGYFLIKHLLEKKIELE